MNITRRDLTAGALALSGLRVASAAPARAEVHASPPPMLDVIVLGAGLSGLQAAWLLQQEGASVVVLEGRHRVGGRVFTRFDQPGYPEMGFNSMGSGYGRGIDAAKRAGVELVDVAPRFAKSYRQELVVGRDIVSREAWRRSAANPFPAAQKSLMPWEITSRLVSEHNPLTNWAEWLEPKNAALDISMHDFLMDQGLDQAAIRLAFDASPYYGASSYDVSALMFEFTDGWTKTQIASGPGAFAVRGGNQNLPEAMARLLKGDVLLGKVVVGIITEATGVSVVCADGSSHRAKQIVCSLPFSTLRRIRFEPDLEGLQAQAVQTLPYQPITNVFLTVSSPFWRNDGLNPSMWTDGPLGNVIAQHFGATDDDVTGLLVQARGELASYWDRLGRDALMAMIVQELEAIRPASKGVVKGAAVQSWALDPFNAGDWAYFAPGQISRFVGVMAKPAGRVHFCGEHTATANRGLEGALETAERAALEVLSA